MGSAGHFGYGIGVALVATALTQSPRVRRLAREGMAVVLAGAIKAGKVVVRGTHNLQEE